MTHRSRSVGAAGEPMVIDQGRRGLEQSLHHPNAGASQLTRRGSIESAATSKGSREDTERVIRDQIAGLVPPDALERVWELTLQLADAREQQVRTATASAASRSASERSLEERIAAKITKAVEDGIGAGTARANARWAEVARTPPASIPTLASTTTNRSSAGGEKPLRQRTDREITIRTRDATDDIKNRNAQQTVQAANRVRGGDAVVAARQLPSKDYVLVFRTPEDAQDPRNEQWVKTVFGNNISMTRPLYTVVAKRVRTESATANTTDLARELSRQNNTTVVRVSKMRQRGGHAAFTTLVLSVASPEEANRLCENGVVLSYEIHDCEPYEESAQPKQCYNCYRFGHIAVHCREKPTCGRCGAAAHSKEDDCPAVGTGGAPKCLACAGAHPAWHRSCPVVQKQREIASRAYQYRASRFATRSGDHALQATSRPIAVPAAPARRRGRPPGTGSSTAKRARQNSPQHHHEPATPRTRSAAPASRPPTQSDLASWVNSSNPEAAPTTTEC